jgi:hypothetical protein
MTAVMVFLYAFGHQMVVLPILHRFALRRMVYKDLFDTVAEMIVINVDRGNLEEPLPTVIHPEMMMT